MYISLDELKRDIVLPVLAENNLKTAAKHCSDYYQHRHRSLPYLRSDHFSFPRGKGVGALCLEDLRQILKHFANLHSSHVLYQTEITSIASLLATLPPSNDLIRKNSTLKSIYTMKTGEINRTLSFYEFSNQENNVETLPKKSSIPLHIACQLPNPSSYVDRLLVEGSPVNQRDSQGRTPLHILVLGGLANASYKEAFDNLLWRGASVWFKDDFGNTPLLCVHYLLKQRRFDAALRVSHALLESGADVNTVNLENRSLLSYSLQYLDSSIELTKLLFNYGASIWGIDSPSGDDNAFKWLLKGIMGERKLSNCNQSLKLVSELMCKYPARMEALVLRTMTRHSTCYQVYGPLFIGIQIEIKKYWKEPQTLGHLCRLSIRENLRDSAAESVSLLHLPPVIEKYLLLDDISNYHC